MLAYLETDLRPLDDPALEAAARTYARGQGLGSVPVRVQDVSGSTSAPNAVAVGFGPSRRVVLWDTLLDGRFDDGEVRVVLAHELGHLSRRHVWKSVGWYALLALPGLLAIALVTRRRGGMAEPRAVPVALLVVVVLELLALPLDNAFSRRLEAEADWVALRTTATRTPAVGLFHGFARTTLSEPAPPAWAHVLLDSHPTLLRRIATAEAWRARNVSLRPSPQAR